MKTRSCRVAVHKSLIAATLLAAGLANQQGAQAQTFNFIDSDASASTIGGGTDSFSGPGTWHVESHFFGGFAGSDAEAWGMPTSMGLYAYDWSDSFQSCTGHAQVISQFTVSSDALVTVAGYVDWPWQGPPCFESSLIITDLTDGTVLLSVNDFEETLDIQLFADRLYEYSSFTINASTGMTVTMPGDLDGDGDVDFDDLTQLLASWGEPGCNGALPCPADVDGDGDVDFDDFTTLLANWS